MEKYPWYEIVEEDSILQGDIVNSCPVAIPPRTIGSGKCLVEVMAFNVIVMSQSCDIEQKKLELALVCPIWSMKEIEIKNPDLQPKKMKESLRKGHIVGYHLLNKCDINGYETDYLIVDFRNVYGVDLTYLRGLIKEQRSRLRLLPPYREHLSQAFARFFMRVGLPVDIPSFS